MLRTRLFLNLLPFVVILLAVGSFAMVLLTNLAENVDTNLRTNYEHITEAQAMSEELARMDKGVILSMEWGNKSGDNVFQENRKLFQRKLKVLLLRTDLPNEGPLTQELLTNYQAFRLSAVAILSLDLHSEQHKIYNEQFYPRLQSLNRLLYNVRRLNHTAILATNRRARDIARHFTYLMLVGLVIALTISCCACYQIAQSILRPIQHLTQATRDIGEGHLDQLVPVISRDELGQLAISFNKMAMQLRAYRDSTSGEIMRLHRLMVTTLASFPDPIYVLNRHGRIELMNPSAEELARHFPNSQELPDRLQAAARQVLQTDVDFLPDNYKEAVTFHHNGQEKHFLPRMLAMRDKEMTLLGVGVVLYDVTQFRLLDDVKTNLLATVSHEIKTPLTSIRMALYLLLEQTVGELNAKQHELVHTARDDVERLLRILNDLLDLARLEGGEAELHKEKVAPSDLLQCIRADMDAIVTAKGLRLECSIAPNLPLIRVDRQRIGLALTNLITNAIKHSPPGDSIHLRTLRSGDYFVQFSVIDHGPGVPREYRQRIFDRFFRVPGQTRSGAGLGLSIAKGVVVAHGGWIGVKCRPGQGSEFYIVLPCLEEDEPSEIRPEVGGGSEARPAPDCGAKTLPHA